MKYDREKLIQKLIEHEGLELKPYKDTLGILTIGIGRNLEDRGISEDEAVYLAKNDVQIVEKELLAAQPCVDTLDSVRQLVLIDMAFNMGVPRLLKFKNMWAAIQENKFDIAAKEMLDSRWATQVKSRSVKLANMMHKGE
jgi:lysozyme|tara:strand:- start:648 stop:1067 length:420 start_codon:yes stop_codon:yes gene_type:complete